MARRSRYIAYTKAVKKTAKKESAGQAPSAALGKRKVK